MVKIRYRVGDTYGSYPHLMQSVRFGVQQEIPEDSLESQEDSLENSFREEVETISRPLQGKGKKDLVRDLTKTIIDAKEKGERLGADEMVVSFIGIDPHTVGRKKYEGKAEIKYTRYVQA